MLSELRVRDLGVIEDLTLHLGPGMTALTGETGAGKTLVVEALQLVLGGRAAPGLVRAGAAEAVVEARFVLPGIEGEADPAGRRGSRWCWPAPCPPRGARAPGSTAGWCRSRPWWRRAASSSTSTASTSTSRCWPRPPSGAPSTFSPARTSRPVGPHGSCSTGSNERLAALGGDDHQRAREADVLRHQCAEIAAAASRRPRRGSGAGRRGGAAGRPLRASGRGGRRRWPSWTVAPPRRPSSTCWARRRVPWPAARRSASGRPGCAPPRPSWATWPATCGAWSRPGRTTRAGWPTSRPAGGSWPTCVASTGPPWPRCRPSARRRPTAWPSSRGRRSQPRPSRPRGSAP